MKLKNVQKYYCENDVKELVDHLQSKVPVWHDIEKTKPEYDEIVFILTDGEIYKAVRDYDGLHKMDYFDCGNKIFDIEQVQLWCYKSELLKTLPEIKMQIVWFDPRKKLPDDGSDVLWMPRCHNRHIIYAGEFSEEYQFITVDNNDVEELRIVHDIEDVKFWTYSSLILKYSENKK